MNAIVTFLQIVKNTTPLSLTELRSKKRNNLAELILKLTDQG